MQYFLRSISYLYCKSFFQQVYFVFVLQYFFKSILPKSGLDRQGKQLFQRLWKNLHQVQKSTVETLSILKIIYYILHEVGTLTSLTFKAFMSIVTNKLSLKSLKEIWRSQLKFAIKKEDICFKTDVSICTCRRYFDGNS